VGDSYYIGSADDNGGIIINGPNYGTVHQTPPDQRQLYDVKKRKVLPITERVLNALAAVLGIGRTPVCGPGVVRVGV
jgi:hypothetical protein